MKEISLDHRLTYHLSEKQSIPQYHVHHLYPPLNRLLSINFLCPVSFFTAKFYSLKIGVFILFSHLHSIILLSSMKVILQEIKDVNKENGDSNVT